MHARPIIVQPNTCTEYFTVGAYVITIYVCTQLISWDFLLDSNNISGHIQYCFFNTILRVYNSVAWKQWHTLTSFVYCLFILKSFFPSLSPIIFSFVKLTNLPFILFGVLALYYMHTHECNCAYGQLLDIELS